MPLFTITSVVDDIEFNVISLKIYPKILSIYNYEDFNLRKIIIENINIIIAHASLSLNLLIILGFLLFIIILATMFP